MKILTPDFERLNVETDAIPQTLVVSDDAIQTIARLFVYDTNTRIWTPLLTQGGKLEVAQENAYETLFFATAIGTSDLLVLSADTSRRQVIAKNIGASMLYIARQTPINPFNRYSLAPGETVTLTRYIDALYAVSNVGTDIAIISSSAV